MTSKTRSYVIAGIIAAVSLFLIASFFILKSPSVTISGAAAAGTVALAAKAASGRKQTVDQLGESVAKVEAAADNLRKANDALVKDVASVESSVKTMSPEEKISLGNKLLKPKGE